MKAPNKKEETNKKEQTSTKGQKSTTRRNAAGLARRLAFPVQTAYLWALMTLFGAVILETFMIYPNVFFDPPASLETAMEFLAVSGPDDFFPPLGFASWVLGAAALLLSWRIPPVRWWIALSLALIVAEGVVSILYFWPRNTIMFSEGTAVHSVEYLRQVAAEFVSWHSASRLVFNTGAAAAAFTGLLTAYRYRIEARGPAAGR